MNNLTQITDKLYAVEVPLDATDIQDTFADGVIWKVKDDWDSLYFDGGFNLEAPYEILGTVTEESIDFDCERYVEPSIDLPEYKYGGEIHPKETYWDYTMNSFWMDSSDDSFISLLSSKDISFDGDTKILIIEKL